MQCLEKSCVLRGFATKLCRVTSQAFMESISHVFGILDFISVTHCPLFLSYRSGEISKQPSLLILCNMSSRKLTAEAMLTRVQFFMKSPGHMDLLCNKERERSTGRERDYRTNSC